jgi:Putative GTPase activating protein for Arf
LGVHISFVRSVDMDEWKTAHVKNMVRWGNRKANAYWEAKMPRSYTRPNDLSSMSEVQQFVRDKYELRKWAAPGDPKEFLDSWVDGDDDEAVSSKKSKKEKKEKKEKKDKAEEEDEPDFFGTAAAGGGSSRPAAAATATATTTSASAPATSSLRVGAKAANRSVAEDDDPFGMSGSRTAPASGGGGFDPFSAGPSSASARPRPTSTTSTTPAPAATGAARLGPPPKAHAHDDDDLLGFHAFATAPATPKDGAGVAGAAAGLKALDVTDKKAAILAAFNAGAPAARPPVGAPVYGRPPAWAGTGGAPHAAPHAHVATAPRPAAPGPSADPFAGFG